MNMTWPDYLLLLLLMTLGTLVTRSFFFMVGVARRMP